MIPRQLKLNRLSLPGDEDNDSNYGADLNPTKDNKPAHIRANVRNQQRTLKGVYSTCRALQSLNRGQGEQNNQSQGLRNGNQRGGRRRPADESRPSYRNHGNNSDTNQDRQPDLLNFGSMRNYERKDPANILLSLGHWRSGLYELLNLPRQNLDMVKLTVSVIAKGCKCDTAPQNKTSILSKLIGSPFLTIGVPDLLRKISTDEDIKESQETFRNICVVVLALFLNIPSTHVNMDLLGLYDLIEGVMDKLKTRTCFDDDLMKIFNEIQEQKDKRLTKIKNRGLSEEQKEQIEELDAPDDFRDISLLPTMEDIDPSVKPFLRKNKLTGGYANSNDYLDVQFRLLREDFIQPLRNGIEEYQTKVRGENIERHRFSDIRVYTGVSIIRYTCSWTDLLHRLQFDVSQLKSVNWQISKRLIFGSLVCLSSDEFQTFYLATVCDRDPKKLTEGYIDVKFEHQLNEIDVIPVDQKFVMVETTAYYEAYKHVLKGLQGIQHVPFERYIVQSNSSVNPPRYLLDNPSLDLRPLVDDNVRLRGEEDHLRQQGRKQNYDFSEKSKAAEKVTLLNLQSWPDHELLNLDESQFAALQTALTKEFSVLQGPPGTGKTYVGLKIVKALLHNSSAWNYDNVIKRPMLIVSYTNHALDQFLEGISSFYDGKIVRVGGRISSKEIEDYSIRAWRKKFKDAKRFVGLGRISYEINVDVTSLQGKIEKIGQRIEAANRDILTEDELRLVMSPHHREQLSSSFYAEKLRQIGYRIPDTRKLMIEWLGIAVNGIITNEIVQEDEEEVTEYDQDEEVIETEDEPAIMANNRLLDVDETDMGGNLEQVVKESIRHRSEVVAFDVTNFDSRKVTPNDGFQLPRQARKKLKLNLLKQLNSRAKMTKAEADTVTNIWSIDMHKRWRLYRYWVSEHCNKLKEKMSEYGERYKSKCETMKEINFQKDKIIMTEATVIAMTTTGAARYQKILQEVNPRIIVVEEAAEVLEGHIITSLTAGCEQLILIGDHKQLRPNPNVYKLAIEYNLQISLFERMLKNGVHCDCLEIQHRMRPEISKLMKPIYPALKDHFSVKTFDNVKGLAKNIFFIDHKFEEQHNEEIKSHSNSYEAEYISKLADYLLKQGYEKSQITILTTYSGQMYQLKKLLPKSRFQGMRITPVDNFQGEESDIILLSLVRSNIEENVGFLKIENRVCVALSRARKGLYVIGNFEILASQSPLWKEITIILKKSGELGENLLLCCQNHPNDREIEITTLRDFEMAPEGGCQKLCNARLQCGHSCNMACHPTDPDHEEYSCPKPCTKSCKNGHPCKRKCYQECGDCETEAEQKLPRCGHTDWVKCSVSVLKHKCTHPCEKKLDCGHLCGNLCGFPHQCQAMVKKKWSCGHTGDIKCVQKDYAVCRKRCGAILECGHQCTGTCSECFSGRLHKPCEQNCTKNLICDHKCESKCSYCPPCEKKCVNRCEHKECTKKCQELCIRCTAPCAWKCQHFTCSKKCFEPCDRPPCNHPCNKRLKCGHECIGLCGEPCPNLCRTCNKDEVTEIFFGTEDEDDARFVQLKDCGHVIEYESLDNWMNQGTFSSDTISIQMKACPKCKTPIRRCVRYGSIINRLLQSIDEVKQTFIGSKTAIERLRIELEEIFEFWRPQTLQIVLCSWQLKKIIPVASTENHLLAIQNQLELLTNMDKLFVKLEKVEENHRPLSSSSNKEYKAVREEFKKFVEWLRRDRMVFSNQELNDAQEELERLSLYLKFFNLIVTIEKRKVNLGKLQEDTKQCQTLFSDGNPLTKRHLETIKDTMKKMEELAPASGLGISDEEKAIVVTAKDVGLSRDDWLKCKDGKTRAEIQKQYRERKKLNDPNYLNKERLRQVSYRVPASEKDNKRLKIDRERNKLYCHTYREKQKDQKSTEAATPKDQPTQSDTISSSSEVPTKLIVQLPYFKKITPSKKRSKALRKARNTILQLGNKLKQAERSTKRWQKRFERIKRVKLIPKQTSTAVTNNTDDSAIPSTPNPKINSIPSSSLNNGSPITPRTRTETDLRKNGISPRSLPQSVVRKLVVNECLISEIRRARKTNKSQKHKKIINTIVSGKIVKKYRCATNLKTALGISRLASSNSKQIRDFKRKRQPILQRQVSEVVVAFFNRDDVSRMLPGKKDAVTVSPKSKEQTRILNDYLRNLYHKFCTEELSTKLSFSAFCKLRPRNVKLTSLLSRNTCLCSIHQNMALKLKCLRHYGLDVSPNPEVVKKAISLEDMSEKVYSMNQTEIAFEEWQKIEIDGKKKMRIITTTKPMEEFATYLTDQYQLFLEHVERVSEQYKALSELKKTLPTDHLIVQMDFAENFACSSLDEIQSAYWNSTSVTLHPVVVYKRSNSTNLENKNFIMISDVNSHNSTAVLAILRILVPQLRELFPGVTTIHYWTDSPSSQYRNRYIINVVKKHQELFGIDARWNYFEVGHGKGPCDGIGGVCKRMASENVKQGKSVIQDATDFYTWAIKEQKSITPLFYSQKEYDSAADFFKSFEAKLIPGTMKLHAVYISKDYQQIFIRSTSCYCSNCLSGDELCQGWTIPKTNTRTTAPTTPIPTTPDIIPTPVEYIPEVNSFVAASYDSDWYIGKVLEVEEDSEAYISFMTKHGSKGGLTFRWPTRPDEILVPFSDIICKILKPIPVGRTQRFFQLSEEDYNNINMNLQN